MAPPPPVVIDLTEMDMSSDVEMDPGAVAAEPVPALNPVKKEVAEPLPALTRVKKEVIEPVPVLTPEKNRNRD